MSANIEKFLQNLKKTVLGEQTILLDIAEIIKEKTGAEIAQKDIRKTRDIVSVKTNAYIKTEISLKKGEILKDLQQRHPEKRITDII